MSPGVTDSHLMAPNDTYSPTGAECPVDEPVAAPVAGFTPRSLRKARLLGHDTPPYFRPVGSRRVKYLLSQVRAWREARTVRRPITNTPCPPTNRSNMTTATAIPLSTTRDASIAALDSDVTVLHAIRALMLARQHQQQEESGRAVLAEAFSATVAAGLEPTLDAVAATLAGLTESANSAAAHARAATEQVRAAVGRHQEAMKPVRAAIESALSDLRTQRAGAMHQRDTRRTPDTEQSPSIRADIERLKSAGYKIEEPLAASVLTDDEARCQNLIVQALGQQIGRLEVFSKKVALDLAGLARVASEDGHEGILAALAQDAAA